MKALSRLGLIAVAVILAAAAIGAYYLFVPTVYSAPKSSSLSSSSTQSANTTGLVQALNNMSEAFNSRDADTISSFYTSSSLVSWTGNSQGLGGIYQGVDHIRILYGATFGHTSSFSFKVSNQTIRSLGPDIANVSMNVFLSGVSDVVGRLNATVEVQQQWFLQNGVWAIQKENWNYVTFNVQDTGEATVFPQWSLQLSGQSPSLAREHALVWNIAPYLAVLPYGVIASLVVVFLVRLHRNRR